MRRIHPLLVAGTLLLDAIGTTRRAHYPAGTDRHGRLARRAARESHLNSSP